MRLPRDIHEIVSIRPDFAGWNLVISPPDDGAERMVAHFRDKKAARHAEDVLLWTLQDWRDA